MANQSNSVTPPPDAIDVNLLPPDALDSSSVAAKAQQSILNRKAGGDIPPGSPLDESNKGNAVQRFVRGFGLPATLKDFGNPMNQTGLFYKPNPIERIVDNPSVETVTQFLAPPLATAANIPADLASGNTAGALGRATNLAATFAPAIAGKGAAGSPDMIPVMGEAEPFGGSSLPGMSKIPVLRSIPNPARMFKTQSPTGQFIPTADPTATYNPGQGGIPAPPPMAGPMYSEPAGPPAPPYTEAAYGTANPIPPRAAGSDFFDPGNPQNPNSLFHPQQPNVPTELQSNQSFFGVKPRNVRASKSPVVEQGGTPLQPTVSPEESAYNQAFSEYKQLLNSKVSPLVLKAAQEKVLSTALAIMDKNKGVPSSGITIPGFSKK